MRMHTVSAHTHRYTRTHTHTHTHVRAHHLSGRAGGQGLASGLLPFVLQPAQPQLQCVKGPIAACMYRGDGGTCWGMVCVRACV